MKKIINLIRVSIVVSILLWTAHGVEASGQYTFTTFDVPGAIWTDAYGIDNAGNIVGSYEDANGAYGFYYDGSQYDSLDAGGQMTHAIDINESGLIVGRYSDYSGVWHGFIYDPMNDDPMNDPYTILDYPGAEWTEALGINNNGEVVGYFRDDTGYDHAFLYDGNNYYMLDNFRWAHEILDNGDIVGHYMDGGYVSHGLLYDGTGYSTLDYPGANDTYALGMNSAGIIVGDYYVSGDSGTHGFLRDGAGYTTFDFPGAINNMSKDINDSNTVVGTYMDSNYVMHGYVAVVNPDTDGDGFNDDVDNCPNISNPGQENNDGDAQGDVCDPDDDNDGLVDSDEINVYSTDPLNPDTDNDGLNDGAEIQISANPLHPDTDWDGILDGQDNAPTDIFSPNAEGWKLSKNSDFSTSDAEFSTTDTFHIFVWSSIANAQPMKKAEYKIKNDSGFVHKEDLFNTGSSVYTQDEDLSGFSTGAYNVEVWLRDKNNVDYEKKDISINVQ